MSHLSNILNPESECLSPLRLPSPRITPASPSSSTSGALAPAHYPRNDPEPRSHDAHPSCPDTLACLHDTEGRPQHTLPVILRCAILGSPKKRLTIREIYAAMENKYPYYKTAGATWKQSVRHHLSLNRLFERQPRPVSDPGFGSYWTVNLDAPPGTKRPRKRGRPQRDLKEEADAEQQGPPAKKRGRPRKDDALEHPRKDDPFEHPPIATLAIPSTDYGPRAHISAVRTWGRPSYDEADDQTKPHRPPGMPYPLPHQRQQDEFESEEDSLEPRMLTPKANRHTSPGGQRIVHPLPSRGQTSEAERLRLEMATLRRQSSDALSVSMRMSDELAEARAESSRARAALKSAEMMLEDEMRKRREAERLADEESRARRELEEALRNMKLQWTSRDHE